MNEFFLKPAQIFIFVGLFTFVLLGIFGLGHFSGMPMNEDGDMEGCVFTGKTMLCKMSVIEHVSYWKNAFAAILQENATLFVLVVLLVAILFRAKNSIGPPRLSGNDTSIGRLYLKEYRSFYIYNPLQEALSSGILKPKIYGSANS